MITPAAGYSYYWQLLQYIERKLGRTVKMVDRKTYAEVNNLLGTGDIDAAFVCGRPYVEGHDNLDIELLVAPRVNGESVYYSYFIVPTDSPVKDLKGLRGKKFAFTDPMSNSGKLVPLHTLRQMGETAESFFSQTIHTHAHDKSIRAVAEGVVDGAAVDSLIWLYAEANDPGLAGKTRVVWKSPPYGIPPVVTRPGLPQKERDALRQVFLTAHNDRAGKEILAGMGIEQFVLIEDSAYDSIREMLKWPSSSSKSLSERNAK